MLSRCTECETVEGDWKYDEIDGDEVPVCQDCGSVDSLQNIPEHDDLDMER